MPHEHLQLATERLGALGCGVESDLAAAAGGDVAAGGETGPLQAAHVTAFNRLIHEPVIITLLFQNQTRSPTRTAVLRCAHRSFAMTKAMHWRVHPKVEICM